MADLLGYLSIIFGVLSFSDKDRQRMLIFNAISTFLYGMNVLSYNGITGALLSFFSFFIILISLKKNNNLNKKLTMLAPIVGVATFLILGEGWKGVFPALGIFFSTLANLQKDILKMKYIFYGSAISWAIFGLLIGSIPAVLLDVMALISLTYGIKKIKKNNLNPIL